jgi:hypothetical protein
VPHFKRFLIHLFKRLAVERADPEVLRRIRAERKRPNGRASGRRRLMRAQNMKPGGQKGDADSCGEVSFRVQPKDPPSKSGENMKPGGRKR